MEISYKRDFTKSFMYMKMQEQWSSFEREVVTKTKIAGIFCVSISVEEGETVFWYDITGKQALDKIVERNSICEQMLFELLGCLCSVFEQIDRYLLCAENVMLSPETIFYDPNEQKYEFIYASMSKESEMKEFQKLMEFLLPHIDHTDEIATKTAYYVYQECGKEGYSLEKILDSLPVWETQKKEIEKETFAFSEIRTQEEEVSETGKDFIEKEREKNGIRLSLKNDFFKWLKEMGHRLFPDYLKIRQLWKKYTDKKQSEIVVFEPEEHPKKSTHPTVLLSDIKVQIYGILKYEGEDIGQDLRIFNTPYVIGSGEECDGKIESDTISRQHAQITKVEDVYFIEDLNSANGTRVGGVLLEYKTKVSIQANEAIQFADKKFRFL